MEKFIFYGNGLKTDAMSILANGTRHSDRRSLIAPPPPKD